VEAVAAEVDGGEFGVGDFDVLRVAALVEAGRLTGGFGYATYAYLGRARAPEARLVGATRSASAVRFAGLIAAAARRRRLGGALLVSASACSIALTARAARG